VEFTAFVATRRPELVRAAVLMGLGHHDAEDQVQNALVRCRKKWDVVSSASDPDAYVYRVLINCTRTARRRRSASDIVVDNPSTYEPSRVMPAAADTNTGLAVRAALRDLPREQREVLVLRYFVDLRAERTAEVLGLPRGTVASRTSRALKSLIHSPHLSPEDRHV
jgi:RNA polymerase sigma-70 factor (sigma-E family)